MSVEKIVGSKSQAHLAAELPHRRRVKKEGFIELKIRDNGNGIPSADLKHIFKRFYRGKALAGEQPGMGLGLAYVKLLVEAHGGEIYVESVLGAGTCFNIQLPQ